MPRNSQQESTSQRRRRRRDAGGAAGRRSAQKRKRAAGAGAPAAPEATKRGKPAAAKAPPKKGEPRSRAASPPKNARAPLLTSALEPYRKLGKAVLRESVVEYRRRLGRGERSAPNGHELYLLEQYFLAEDYESPFSFCNCCEMLDLDPEAVRREIFEGAPPSAPTAPAPVP